jgi:hypothetical protein
MEVHKMICFDVDGKFFFGIFDVIKEKMIKLERMIA